MKKRYTKKQIVEAINYWKKQLRAGNYKKLNEYVEADYDDDEDYTMLDGTKPSPEIRAHNRKMMQALKKQAQAIGLGPDEIVCLLLGKLCVCNNRTGEARSLTAEEYDKYCELEKQHLDV